MPPMLVALFLTVLTATPLGVEGSRDVWEAQPFPPTPLPLGEDLPIPLREFREPFPLDKELPEGRRPVLGGGQLAGRLLTPLPQTDGGPEGDGSASAGGSGSSPPIGAAPKARWWKRREERKPEIYFPHNVHMEIMRQEGDVCMVCHSFQSTEIVDIKLLKRFTEILNEPLKAICHDCHVVERRAPWRCAICHPDKTKIWPQDHNFGYLQHHAEAARRNERACRECHLELSYCTDCHFRRRISGFGYHPPGYLTLHGIEARTMPLNCGRCHNPFYCDNCHRRRR